VLGTAFGALDDAAQRMFFIDFECVQACNLHRSPKDLWLKVILSPPARWMLLATLRNPATGR
jgi:hypothetical protein